MQSTHKVSTGNAFGKRLHILRTERNWSLQQLAERLDCDRSYLSRLETGKATNPSTDFVRGAAAVLGVNEQWLELGIGDPQASPVEKDLAENTQFLTAISILVDQMGLQQMLRSVNNLTRSSVLSDKSKTFWLHVLAPWIAVKIRLDHPPRARAAPRNKRARKKKS
jgi:transcriptional regulator with XRE-family HTH domain